MASVNVSGKREFSLYTLFHKRSTVYACFLCAKNEQCPQVVNSHEVTHSTRGSVEGHTIQVY